MTYARTKSKTSPFIAIASISGMVIVVIFMVAYPPIRMELLAKLSGSSTSPSVLQPPPETMLIDVTDITPVNGATLTVVSSNYIASQQRLNTFRNQTKNWNTRLKPIFKEMEAWLTQAKIYLDQEDAGRAQAALYSFDSIADDLEANLAHAKEVFTYQMVVNEIKRSLRTRRSVPEEISRLAEARSLNDQADKAFYQARFAESARLLKAALALYDEEQGLHIQWERYWDVRLSLHRSIPLYLQEQLQDSDHPLWSQIAPLFETKDQLPRNIAAETEAFETALLLVKKHPEVFNPAYK